MTRVHQGGSVSFGIISLVCMKMKNKCLRRAVRGFFFRSVWDRNLSGISNGRAVLEVVVATGVHHLRNFSTLSPIASYTTISLKCCEPDVTNLLKSINSMEISCIKVLQWRRYGSGLFIASRLLVWLTFREYEVGGEREGAKANSSKCCF